MGPDTFGHCDSFFLTLAMLQKQNHARESNFVFPASRVAVGFWPCDWRSKT